MSNALTQSLRNRGSRMRSTALLVALVSGAHGLHVPVSLHRPSLRHPPVAASLAGPEDSAGARNLLAASTAVYGTNYACVKLLDEWVGSAADGTALRFTVAALVLVPLLVGLSRKEPRLVQRQFALDGMEQGGWFFLGYVAQAVALETSSAALQAFLMSLAVVVCPILEAAFLGREQRASVWVSALLATIGVAALEMGGVTTVDQAATLGGPAPGDVIGLLQPLFFGIGFYRLERAMARHDAAHERAGATALGLCAWQSVPMCIFAYVWAATSHGGSAWDVPHHVAAAWDATAAAVSQQPLVLGALLWTGLVTGAGCAYAEAVALGRLPSSAATVVFATEPLWAAGFAAVVLGERLGGSGWAGGALVLAACACSGSDDAADAVEASADEARRAVAAALAPSAPSAMSASEEHAARGKARLVPIAVTMSEQEEAWRRRRRSTYRWKEWRP